LEEEDKDPPVIDLKSPWREDDRWATPGECVRRSGKAAFCNPPLLNRVISSSKAPDRRRIPARVSAGQPRLFWV
jgi:hypothetical protein